MITVTEATAPTAEALKRLSDVRAAADILHSVYTTSHSVDGRVSIEIDPRLAHDTAATVAEAKQLAWLVDRPKVMIKIPATKAGLPAITEAIGPGISVNAMPEATWPPAALGVPYDEVVTRLEDECVAKFEAAWEDLLSTVRKSLQSKGADAE